MEKGKKSDKLQSKTVGKQFATCQSLTQALLWWLEADGWATIERVKDNVSGKWGYGLFEIGKDDSTPDYL